MPIKLELFKKIEPIHLSKLARDIKDIVSDEALNSILDAYIEKIRRDNRIDDS